MAPPDDKLRSFIDKVRKEHPECRYSSSTSKECSSNNGNFACETIRRIFKTCPGARPEKIYEKTTRDSGTGSGGGGGGGTPEQPGPDSGAKRSGGASTAPPPNFKLFKGAEEADEIARKVEEQLKGFIGDSMSAPTWQPKIGATTPDLPPPHKSQSLSKDNKKAQGGTVVEQA